MVSRLVVTEMDHRSEKMKKIMVIFGTRPEAIKMCPLVLELNNYPDLKCKICLTGQHEEMLNQVMQSFELKEDYNLHIMKERQTLSTITTNILEKLDPILEKEHPDIVLVHGDTTTSFAAALAAFYKKIPVGHVEAGLRSGNKYSPYPEEMNRKLTAQIADFHFAPTENNKRNLERENIKENVYVTGNTVIDSFKTTIKKNYCFQNKILQDIDYTKKIILVTAHRRENLGKPLENICNAIKRIAEKHKDVVFIYPVHLNPEVRKVVFSILEYIKNVKLLAPIDVLDMHNLMNKSYMIMTDSGGIQEEAPALGKPVLVLRTETERPEAAEAGTVKVVGVNEDTIFEEAEKLLNNEEYYNTMAKAVNPYGNGFACKTIAEIIKGI